MKTSGIFILFILFASFLAGQNIDEEAYLIKSIYFGGGSYGIDSEQIRELEEWLNAIPDIEKYDISVHSHTDNIGSIEYNNFLSKMRSQAVLQELIRNEIPREFIVIEDFGELNPMYNNNTWQGKLHNRRVDIILKPFVL